MKRSSAGRRTRTGFDLRALIGGVFAAYGVVCGVAGVFASEHDLHRAAGVNVNLWAGVGMFLFGLVMLAWWRWRPVHPDQARVEQKGEF